METTTISKPVIQHRDEQPYVAIRIKVAMDDISTKLPPLLEKVFAWTGKHEVECSGYPFFRYLRMDNNQVLVDVGMPVRFAVKGDTEVVADSFADGKYVVATHVGDYSHLREAHMELEKWVQEKGLKEGRRTAPNGEQQGSRTEFYITDPRKEPSPEKWQTEIVLWIED